MNRGILLVAVATIAACGGTSAVSTPDAAVVIDAPPVVVPDAPRDGSPPLTWVDFVASGCGSYDPSGPVCSGPAPLSLRFVAIAPAPIDTFIWSFGDGQAGSTERAPLHVFAVPGAYTIQLTVGGAGGSTQQARKEMFVVVAPLPLGSACSVDAQCESGLDCVCGAGQSCPASLAQGLCARPCGTAGAVCGDHAVCADLGPAGNPQNTPWQRALCLESCSADSDCGGGLRCRELRAGTGGDTGWVRGCFAPDLVVDDGQPCDAPNGTPDSTRCASGSCVAYGARGLCAAGCTAGAACPSYAACAQVSTGDDLCLTRCTAARPCGDDPWLDCEAPAASGTYGFTVAGGAAGATYCAPRRCTDASMCGTDGVCRDGFCTRAQ